MGTPTIPVETGPVDDLRLQDLVVFEYRSVVLQRLAVTAEWRALEWTEAAACADHPAATRTLCDRCPVVAECLAAAIASDDRAQWRGGLDRTERQQLWAELEQTYRDVRDLELMHLDTTRLLRLTGRRPVTVPTAVRP